MQRIFCLGVVLLACSFSAHAADRPPTVFQIGVADGDFGELALVGNHTAYSKQFPGDVNFVVGKSDPKQDWPYIQPGPADAWAGRKPHPFKITFQVGSVDQTYDRLVIDYVRAHPTDAPVLRVDINGQAFERKLLAGGTEAAVNNPKAGKAYSLQQLIPPVMLHMGENSITLTNISGSWSLFDDVRLESGIPAPAQMVNLHAEPLPFFKQTPNGLQRAVRVSIDSLEGGDLPAELSWKTKDKSGSQKLQLRFGENQQTLMMVPDVDRVEFAVRAGPHEANVPVTLPAAKKWRVYIVPTAHTDVGYTDLQDRVKVRHANNGMTILQWLDQYPEFKWYSETYWQLNALLDLHPEKSDEIFDHLRQKRWGLSGDYANMLTGLCSSEALNRLTLDSRNLANRGGFELNSVVLDDVPAAIGSVPMVLANSGIKYFIEGANKDRAPYSGINVPNPFYWEGPDGSRVLTEIVHGYGAARRVIQQAPEQLPDFLAGFDTPDYPYDAVLVNGGFGDNALVQPWIIQAVQQWNAEWDYPKLILAQPDEFFGYIEKNFADKIPVLKTDFGGWWEDGAGSTAVETLLSRRAEERIVTAEMLHSVAGILGKAAYPKDKFDEVWHDILLYNEHTWGASASVRQPEAEQTVKQWQVKAAFAHDADAASRSLLASGMSQLAAIAPPADLVVFNPLAWSRSALVTTDLPGAVQDRATKKISLCQALPEGGNCFLADDLPSIGYRSYDSTPVGGPASDAAEFSGHQMENEFYRVTLNPKTGGVQSILDKQTGRELVDPDREQDLGELIYVTGGDGTYAIHSDLDNLPPPQFEYHRQTGTKIEHSVGPVFGELSSESSAQNFPKIKMRIRLYRGLKQLDLIFELDKTETTAREAVYLAFPFAVDARKGGIWLEYPDEITEPLRDQHSSACRDWYSVQRWLAVSDGQSTVELSPLDAPLFTIGEMTASTWPRQLTLKRGHVFGYIMNNYWHTNYKASQGGPFTFRYSLTSGNGGFSKKDAVVKGWNMYCPPATSRGQKDRKPLLSSAAQSLVAVEPVGLPLTTIKQAEDGSGYVMRLCDFAGAGGTATLTLPQSVRELFNCDLVECNPNDMKETGKTISAPVKPFGPVTLKARFEP